MPTSKDGEYVVGYRRPPRQSRFKKGESGNPKGRPRGAKNLTPLLAQALSEPVVVTENGRRRKLTKLAAACKQLVNRALSGDLRAMKLLLELVRAIETKAEDASPYPLTLDVMAELRRRYEADVAKEASEARPPLPIRPLTRGTQ